MTFLELQNYILQTRKARRGVSNRRDYFEDADTNTEQFYNALYRKALDIANRVVKHYDETGRLNSKEKIAVTFGEDVKKQNAKQESDNLFTENFARQENDILRKRIKHLQSENEALKKQLADFQSKFTHGGRKGYGDDMTTEVKSARDNGETWRGLSKRLGISPTTAQKLYQK